MGSVAEDAVSRAAAKEGSLGNADKTVKAVFYIEPREEHNRVQHIGCRLVITEKLLHAHFQKGGVFNLPDGRVQVILEGREENVRSFYEDVRRNLVGWLEEKSSDRGRLKKMIGNPGIVCSGLEIKKQYKSD